MKHDISKLHVLGMLALPLFAVAVLTILLSFEALSINKQASANRPNASLEFTLHVGPCSTTGDVKGNCVVAIGSEFIVSVSLDAIPGAYDAIAITLNYSGVIRGQFEAAAKGPPRIAGHWPDCVFEAIPEHPLAGLENVSCAVGTSQVATGSSFLGTVFTTQLTCASAGVGEVHLVHSASDTLMIDIAGKTSTDNGPDRININCAPTTPTATPTQTSTPATAVSTPTETMPPLDTPPATSVATSTATPTRTSTAITTAISTPTQTPLQTLIATRTATRTPTQTRTPTRTPTRTRTPSPGGLVGDVNCSGGISAIDAALILQLDAGIVSSLPCQQNGLVNGDGIVNSLDALLILQYVAGIIPSLPA